MNSTAETIDTPMLSSSDQQLLEAVRTVLAERAMWKAEAARLHRLLQQQIAQNGELIRQGRKLDGEAAPQYVVAADWPEEVTL
ncbi:MAG: hypothetical protein WC565_06910 [Parcubacteria group bacterium]